MNAMMPALDGLAGIIILVIFGSAFLITCGISAIKAIRDRSRLKKRKSRRKSSKDKNEKCSEDWKRESHIRVVQCPQLESKKYRSPKSGNEEQTDTSTISKNTFENVDLSVYSINEGEDNLTFRHSNSSIVEIEENKGSSIETARTDIENVPPVQRHESKTFMSHEKISYQDKNPNRLPTDCFVIRKITRRHSYEVAICENSWMPQELPGCSRTKLDATNVDENKGLKKTVDVSFVNEAYDNEDFENT